MDNCHVIVPVLIVLADTLDEELKRVPYKQDELRLCLVDCSNGAYYFDCRRDYYDIGAMAKPKNGFQVQAIRLLVFGGRVPKGPAELRTELPPDAVQGSCAALLQVSGLIVFFSSVLSVLRAARLTALLPNRLAEALACGALELSSGILLLSGPGTEAACAFLMGWGGLCVHFQAMSLWQTAGLRPRGYFSAKLLHALLAAVLALARFAPSPATLLPAGALTACALLAPLLRKIRAGNLRRAAV